MSGEITELVGLIDNMELSMENPYRDIYSMSNLKDPVETIKIGSGHKVFNIRGFCVDELPKDDTKEAPTTRGRWADVADEL